MFSVLPVTSAVVAVGGVLSIVIVCVEAEPTLSRLSIAAALTVDVL
jgi:hypothetical protein